MCPTSVIAVLLGVSVVDDCVDDDHDGERDNESSTTRAMTAGGKA